MKLCACVASTLLSTAISLSLISNARAQSFWDINADAGAGGTGSAAPSGTWDVGSTANWNANSDGTGAPGVWTDGSDAVFAAGNDATGAYTVTLGGTVNANSIAVEEGNVTITGGTSLDLSGLAAIDVATGSSASIDSVMGGFSQIAKNGAGTLDLIAANAFSGMMLNAGTVRVNNNNALGANLSSVTIGDGTTLAATASTARTLTYAYSVGGNFTLGQASGGTGVLTLGGASGSGATLDLGGAVRTITVNNGSDTISASIGNGGIIKEGTGTLTLSAGAAANTYTGAVTVNAGILASSAATGLGTSAGGVTVNDGATLQVSGGNTQPDAIVLSGTGSTGSNGALRKTGNNTTTLSGVITGSGTMAITTGTLTLTANNTPFTGSINVTGGGRLSINALSTGGTTGLVTLDNGIIRNTNTSGAAGTFISSTRNINLGAGGGTLDWAGATTPMPSDLIIVQTGTVISGTAGGTLHKTGAGTISVVTPATYDGPTHVAAGTLRVRTNNNVFPTGTALTVDAGAIFDLNGLNQAVGSVAGAGNINLGDGAFTNGSSDASTTFSGQFVETAGGTGGTVTKQGTGTLTLSGNNLHTGLTTISTTGGAGAIAVQSNTALGTTAGSTTVASGAQLQIDGSGLDIPEPLTITGTGLTTTGAVRNLANDNTLSGAIALSGNARIQSDAGMLTVTGTIKSSSATSRNLTVGGAGNTTISGVIGDGANPIGNLTKADAGTATLTGPNIYTGNTTVQAGILSISNQFLPDASDVLLLTGSTLNLNFTGTPDTIDSLFINSVSQATGTWGTLGSGADHESALISGTGLLLVSNFVPPAGLPGDFNDDDKVDAADYVTWRANETANVALPNDNGVGNQPDRYTLWRSSFGNPGAGGGLGSSAAVPEPATVALVLAGLTMLGLGRCRSR